MNKQMATDSIKSVIIALWTVVIGLLMVVTLIVSTTHLFNGVSFILMIVALVLASIVVGYTRLFDFGIAFWYKRTGRRAIWLLDRAFARIIGYNGPK